MSRQGRNSSNLMVHALIENLAKVRTWKALWKTKCLHFSCVPHSSPLSCSGQSVWPGNFYIIKLYFKSAVLIRWTINSWKCSVMHGVWRYLCWLFLFGIILLVFLGVSVISAPLSFPAPVLSPHCSLARPWIRAHCDSLLLIVVIYSSLWD